MRQTLIILVAQLMIKLVQTSNSPIDCFGVSGLYGTESSGTLIDDGDLLEQLSKDHVLTSFVGCTNEAGYLQSIQFTYGVWESSKITNEVKLNEFGTLGDNCSTTNLIASDLVTTVGIYYSDVVEKLVIITKNGFFSAIGKESKKAAVKEYNFDQEKYRFFGLHGTESANIQSIGVIRFNF